MGTIYEELDEVKAEIEKLRAEYRTKVDLCDSLKRVHNEQLNKLQEASSRVEKLSQELNEKLDEICVTKQLYEDVKSNLNEKESAIKHLRSANDKIRMDCDTKLRKCEEENRGLALALDEANARNMDQEQQIRLLTEEVKGLQELVTVSQKKCLEAQKKVGAPRELRQRDDMLLNLEEENRKFEDQLKWKKEQFNHLEQAHAKLRNQFQLKEKEWKKERAALFDELSGLETKLDAQTRFSEGLQSQLQMCNQALAHEESKRKYLEAQLSVSNTSLNNVLSEYEDAKSIIESLTGQRDKEIAALRDTLGTKESLYKETEYQVQKLKQENQELATSIKELQEAGIQEARCSSLPKLRNKLRNLEQVQRDCSMKLKAKEAECNSQLAKAMEDLKCCRSELEKKNRLIEKLTLEVESCDAVILQLALQNEEASFMLLMLKSEFQEARFQHFRSSSSSLSGVHEKFTLLEQVHGDCPLKLGAKEAEWSFELGKLREELNCSKSELKSRETLVEELKLEVESCDALISSLALQNEETSLMLLVLKSEISEMQAKLVDMDLNAGRREESLSILMDQLESKNIALAKAANDVEEEREKVATLSKKVDSINDIELQQESLQKELAMNKDLLNESYTCQNHLKKQVSSLKSNIKAVEDALDRANEELAQKFCEGNEVEFELQIWKSIAEQLKATIEENHQLRQEVEASLLAQVDVEVNLKEENNTLVNALNQKEQRLEELQQKIALLNQDLKTKEAGVVKEDLEKEIEWLEQEWVRKELEASVLAHLDAVRNHEHEKENLNHIVDEKDHRIVDLQQLVRSLEKEFESSTSSFSSSLQDMLVEIDMFHEAWERIKTAEVLKEVEIQEKHLMILEFENELSSSQQKAVQLEKALSSSERKRDETKAELEARELEALKLTSKLEVELSSAHALIDKLNEEKSIMLEDISKLSSDRENLLVTVMGLSDRIHKLSREDMQLMEYLGIIVQTSERNGCDIDWERNEEFFDPVKENQISCPSPTLKKAEAVVEERSPFRVLNN